MGEEGKKKIFISDRPKDESILIGDGYIVAVFESKGISLAINCNLEQLEGLIDSLIKEAAEHNLKLKTCLDLVNKIMEEEN